MIKNHTVFVLGAGASQAYGFPSGQALVDRICRRLLNASKEVQTVCDAAGVNTNDVERFRRQLLQSRLNSIDAFLQRRQEWATLGKCAIAQDLMTCESEDKLYPPPEQDWYRTLFNEILPATPDEFRANQLKVITFNFDRSFEHALFRSLETLFDMDLGADGYRNHPVEMLAMLPVLHLHGHLGELGYLPNRPFSRIYMPANDARTIATAATHIKVIQDEINEQDLAMAREWLDGATTVCFLGFGYHDMNLSRLDVRRTLRGPSKTTFATRYLMGDGKVGRTQTQWFHGLNVDWQSRDRDIVRFLEETAVIHQ